MSNPVLRWVVSCCIGLHMPGFLLCFPKMPKPKSAALGVAPILNDSWNVGLLVVVAMNGQCPTFI